MHYIPPRSWRIDPERGPYSVIYEDDLIGLLCEVYEDGNGTFSWSVSLDGVEWAGGGNAGTYRSAMDSLNATVDTLASSGTIGRRELILRAADIGTHPRKSFLEEYVARHHLRADPEPAWKFFYHGTNGIIDMDEVSETSVMGDFVEDFVRPHGIGDFDNTHDPPMGGISR